MDEETTIAQGLHTTDDSAGYDAACKRVLSEMAILAQNMSSSQVPYPSLPPVAKAHSFHCSSSSHKV